jgi:hypothetical protein
MTAKSKLLENQVDFITCSGEFSVRSFLDMQPSPKMLYELQGIDFTMTVFERFYSLVNNLRTHKNQRQARIALRCSTDLQLDIGRTLQDLANHRDSNLQLICFKSSRRAMDWLSE